MSDSFTRRPPSMMGRLSAAMGLAIGAAFDPFGQAPTIHKGKHRVAAETKDGRRFISRMYRRSMSRLFVAQRNRGGGPRELARRQRQIAAHQLHPLYRGA